MCHLFVVVVQEVVPGLGYARGLDPHRERQQRQHVADDEEHELDRVAGAEGGTKINRMTPNFERSRVALRSRGQAEEPVPVVEAQEVQVLGDEGEGPTTSASGTLLNSVMAPPKI